MKEDQENIYTTDAPEVIAPELPSNTPELPARTELQGDRSSRPGTRYRFRFSPLTRVVLFAGLALCLAAIGLTTWQFADFLRTGNLANTLEWLKFVLLYCVSGALAVIIVAIAEFIGIQKFGLIVLLPLLYSLVIGAILSFPRWNFIKPAQMERASQMLSIGMLLLLTKIGLDIGPNISMIFDSGLALIMQEFGHFFGTLVFGLPVALLVGMKREAIGACYSIDREANVAIIAERFGLTSLQFNTLETLIDAIGLPKCKVCTHCFDGSSCF